jgi:hypothetical protein
MICSHKHWPALFEGAKHHFVQNKMNDNGGQKNNAKDNNE